MVEQVRALTRVAEITETAFPHVGLPPTMVLLGSDNKGYRIVQAFGFNEGMVAIDHNRSEQTALNGSIATYAALGLNNQQIAEQTCLAVDTVKTHLKRFSATAEIDSRTGIARYMFECGAYEKRIEGRAVELKPGQQEIIELLSLGKDNLQIADELGVSVNVVRNRIRMASVLTGIHGAPGLVLGYLIGRPALV